MRAIDRNAAIAWYRRNRERTAALFEVLDPETLYAQPIAQTMTEDVRSADDLTLRQRRCFAATTGRERHGKTKERCKQLTPIHSEKILAADERG